MKITRIELQNFKRFTDVIISNIPSTAKLVLMTGSNGSGKSSLFDAFNWLKKSVDEKYYKKMKMKRLVCTLNWRMVVK